MARSIKLTRILFFTILGIGIYMRLYQYFCGRNLWEDEAHLALNFIYYGYRDLCKPLANFQSAPILFLFTEESFSRIFGFGALALRAFPLITSLLTLPLIYYIIQEFTGNKISALIGFALYATNLFTIYYSSEIKPYIIDVSVYLLISYLTLSRHEWINKHRIMLLTIAGCFAIMYSTTAPLVLFCTGAYLIFGWYTNRKIIKNELYLLLVWSSVYIIYFSLFLLHHPYSQGMKEIWAFAFCPTNIFSRSFVDFMHLRIQDTLFSSLLYISKDFGFEYIVLFVIIIATIYIFYKRKYRILFFTWLPVLVHLIASCFKLYPFYFRFILYLLPPLMILLAIGTYVIADFIARKAHISLGILFVLYCCFFYMQRSINNFPSVNAREVKPALDFINKNYPNTHIFITTPFTLYEYYNRIGYAKNNNYRPVKWNLTPGEYYEFVKQERSAYVLLSSDSSFGYIDGYESVLKDLKKRHLIVHQFDHMTYQVSEIKPLLYDSVYKNISYSDFSTTYTFEDSEHVGAIWSGNITTRSFFLPRGTYKMNILSRGTPALGIFPHNNVFVNGKKVGDYTVSLYYARYPFSFDMGKDDSVKISVSMDNDAVIKDEDRNTFISNIFISKR